MGSKLQSLTRIGAIVMVLAPFSIASAGETGFFIGGSIGQAQVELEGDPSLDIPDFDDDDSGFKVFGGYNWNLPVFNVGVEVGYVDLGKPSQSFSIDDPLLPEPIDVSLEVDTTGLTAYGFAGFAAGPVDLFAKAGFISWDADLRASVSDPIDPGFGIDESGSESGTDLAYGLGGQINFGKLGVRAEYELYDIEDSDNVSMVSLGVTYTF